MTVYALDFDGVICDSAIETAITGWKVATQIWPEMPEEAPEELISLFRHIRPVLETGYEATLIMRALYEGHSADYVLINFHNQIKHIINRDELNTDKLKQRFGDTRDLWIKQDLASWMAKNPLFSGVKEKLQQLDKKNSYIITTKQERFVSQIFASNGIEFPADQIYGLDRKLSKQQVLKDLAMQHPEQDILFVEDRLPTLHNVINDQQLSAIKLFFATWGYNTQADKSAASELVRVNSINLEQMQTL